jgi:ribosome maturation factor RimP
LFEKWADGPLFIYGDVMAQSTTNLAQLIEPVVIALGYELVAVEHRRGTRSSLLRVYIDSPDGIGVDDCSRVSHQLSGVLDVEEPIAGHYTLEVSSPGLDRLLSKPQDYERFAGQMVKVRLHGLLDGRRKLVGVLKGIEQDQVIIEEEGKEWRLALHDIEQTRLVPDV